MKNRIALIFAGLILVLSAHAQSKPVKIVFDVTSRDTLVQQTAVRHVAGITKSYPNVEIEVVIYGGALSMALDAESTVKSGLELLKDNPRVSFRVCETSMKRHQVTKDQLVKSMGTVPDAIMEIAIKQSEGWAYIKEVKN